VTEEISTNAKILAAQYAGTGDVVFYHNAMPAWVSALLIVSILLLVAVVVIILDNLTDHKPETYKEVNYDYRGMGEERSSNRYGEGKKSRR
jgi:hypothetical protein